MWYPNENMLLNISKCFNIAFINNLIIQDLHF